MDSIQLALLLLAGVAGGLTVSVAGGGLLLIYPILLGLGVPPVSASATGAVSLLPAQLSSDFGYRRFLLSIPKNYYLLLIPAIIGTLLGAWLLGNTSQEAFERIVPWFVLLATGLIIFQPRLHKWLHTRKAKALEKKHHTALFVMICCVMVLLTVYGGYFGAGVGIILLAFFGLTSLTDIRQMNALKNVFGIVINCTSLVYFTHVGLIEWEVAPMLLIGSALGGYVGSMYASRLPTRVVRGIIIVIALCVSAYLFAR